MWIEIDEHQLREQLSQTHSHPTYFFFYTPLCGTCKLAQRMVTIAMEATPGIDVFACNLNQMPQWAFEWQIESVPCLAVVKDGTLTTKMYAFHSVNYVFEQFRNPCSE